MGKRQKTEKEFEVRVDENRMYVHLDIKEMNRLRHTCLAVRHSNPEYEITMIRKGICQVDVGNEHYTLHGGTAMIIPPGVYHILRSETEEFDRFSFRFSLPSGSALAVRLQEQLPDPRIFPISDPVEQLCRLIFELYSAGIRYWNDLYPALMQGVLACIFGQLQLGGEQDSENVHKAVINRMLTVDRYIEQNMSQGACIEELARVMELSQRQVVRVLQESYGMTFRQKLLNARMDRAGWLLRTTQKPLEEVVGEVGYTSTSAFYHAFRKHYGTTPQEYRDDSAIK